MIGIYPFWVKIATWGSEILVNGYDAKDAQELARTIFKIPTDVEITARPKNVDNFLKIEGGQS